MIYGIGTDMIEISRIQKSLENLQGFKNRIFTLSEIEYCESKGTKRFESYAARFAAKEAFLKALGTGWAEGLEWKDFSVQIDEKGKPSGILSDHLLEKYPFLKNAGIHLSLTHCREFASAYLIIESDGKF